MRLGDAANTLHEKNKGQVWYGQLQAAELHRAPKPTSRSALLRAKLHRVERVFTDTASSRNYIEPTHDIHLYDYINIKICTASSRTTLI
jgi:hypothetical protein